MEIANFALGNEGRMHYLFAELNLHLYKNIPADEE